MGSHVAESFSLQGTAAKLMTNSDREVLLDSGAGTGKTYSWMTKAHVTATQNPGSIQIISRQTRRSMSTTVLPDFENDILGPGHAAFGNSRATCEHRDKYRYPNGSELWILGLEHVDRILSAKIDRFYVAQAEEMPSPAPFEKLMTRLRNRKTAYHQGVLDVNPSFAGHWINQRPDEKVCVSCLNPNEDDPDALPDQVLLEDGECPTCGGTEGVARMTRLQYRHTDNPALYDARRQAWTPWGREYVGAILGALSGVERLRLKEHQWVDAEGQIWKVDQAVHLLTGEVRYDEDANTHWLYVPEFREGWEPTESDESRRELTWFSGSLDFGHRNPGCLQVWGHDRAGRRYMVAEVYRAGGQLDDWADWIEQLMDEFPMRRIVADSADGGTGAVEMLNDRLCSIRDRQVGRIVVKANKLSGKLEMLDTVAWGLRVKEDGEPSTYFLRDSLRFGRDNELARKHRPTTTLKEVESFVWIKNQDGKPIREMPDPVCADHGCDAMQYEHAWDWKKDLTPKAPAVAFSPGTYGFLDNHVDVFRQSKRRRLQG